MKIIQLTAENVKKLKVVDITPTKDFIQITGRNGSGKSSVLDSIWWALAGKEAIASEPIRKGEEKAIIKLDLGSMIVTRRFTKAGTTLAVENAEGFKAPSPQAMLDAIIGNLTFDPLEFSRMPAKQQFDTLRQIAEVKIDFEALAKEDAADTERRRDINRDIKNLEGELAGITVSDNAPDEAVDVTKLLGDLEEIDVFNTEMMDRTALRDKKWNYIQYEEKVIGGLKKQLADAQENLTKLNVEFETINATIQPLEDNTAIKAKLSGAEAINKAHAAKQRRGTINAQVALKTKAADEITASLAARTAFKVDALQKTKMPIDGLSLGQGEVVFNDIPFLQLSAAEQLRISVAIAMAANPKLKIIRIKDGSLLDDDSLKMIQAMAGEHEYQIWCEMVNTTGKVGIFMEDGEVRENNDA